MEDKYVTWKNLRVGQKINGYKEDGHWSSFVAYVKSMNSAYVTVAMWRENGLEEKIPSNVMFAIELTEDEFEEKYKEKAKEVLVNIQKSLHRDEIGEKEIWNAWLCGSPFEIAAACKKEKMTVVGHCKDIIPKISLISNESLDVGVCCEYEDGDRIWCHFSTKNIEDMLDDYGYLLTEEKKDE